MADDADDRNGRDPAPAVSRSIRLLGLLADAGRPMTLTELASALSLAKSSTANLCLALEAGGLIERVTTGFRLGLRIAELGGAFAAQFTQVREFYSVCEASPVLSTELVQVALLDGADVLYLARYEGARAERLGAPLGSRLPAALSATGRALLMTKPDAEVRALLTDAEPFPAAAENGTRTVTALLEKLDVARELGWTLDEGEALNGIIGVAVSLEGWAPGDPQLALGVGMPAERADRAHVERVAAALQDAAAALTNPLGASSRRR